MKAAVTLGMAIALSVLSAGCTGRIISESLGAAKGASGKVVSTGVTPYLVTYKGLRIEPITVVSVAPVPGDVPEMIRADFQAAARERGLTPNGKPGLRLVSEIIHYETSSTVDTAIGPLAEVILHAKLIDARSGNVLAEANLVGRSKATSSSGTGRISGGAGKALGKWLSSGGLKKEKSERDEE